MFESKLSLSQKTVFFLITIFLLLPRIALGDQSFAAPSAWVQNFTLTQGWGAEQPRQLADIDGNGRQDVVGFGTSGVQVGLSTGTSFIEGTPTNDFGFNQGWRVQRHVRALGDINGDRRADVVGFGNAGVYTALSTGSRFGQTRFVINDFGYDQGWRVERHVRLLADINADRKDDIVAFGNDGVWLSLATTDGAFTAPAFVIANFGFNQGWVPDRHIRTTADVNGDGRKDIVAFGNDGVWIALSTGGGFTAPRFVLQGFGYLAGSWRVDRHPRMLADINNDGREDIIGFGDAGVWTSLSTGEGFTPMRFVLADFGYNSGWRANIHPRFVADLNGDGHKDIVGYGQTSVYRALGSPTGFTPMRGVLRDLVAARSPFSRSDSSRVAPRFVADVNGNGTAELIAFDQTQVKVALSSNAPPPPPPARPSNLRVTGATSSTLSIAWNDNSDNEIRFIINYGKANGPMTYVTAAANSTSRQIGSLEANTSYCFTIQSESLFDLSAPSSRVCHSTGRKIETTSIFMSRQPTTEGPVPYMGSFGPIFSGAVINNINFPVQYRPVLLVKPGRSTTECNNPSAVVLVHGDMTSAQKIAIWGTATPILNGTQKLNFVGCTTDPQLPGLLPVNITWQQP